MFDQTLLIYGPSSAGKTTSLRNLDFPRTAFVNIEAKPLNSGRSK